MPHVVQISVPEERTTQVVPEIRQLKGLIGLRVQRGISIQPPGDVIAIEILSRDMPQLMRVLDRLGVTTGEDCSVTTSEPSTVISSKHAEGIRKDSSEVIWEEMGLVISKESNPTWNKTGYMLVAGFTAAAAIVTGALHLAIGAMIIAPIFQPFSRIALGIITGQRRAWKDGLKDAGLLYLAFLAGAILSALAMVALGFDLIPGRSSYLETGELFKYWTTISWLAVLISSFAAFLGALLIATNRTVLLSGVVIVLALVPSWSIVGIGLVAGDYSIAWDALQRWLLDVVTVLVFSLLLFGWKHVRVHKRRMQE